MSTDDTPDSALGDPRTFPDERRATPADARLYELARASLGAQTAQDSDACDRELQGVLSGMLAGDGDALATLLRGAPSVAIARHLWRLLDAASSAPRDGSIAVTVFAIPIVVVAGLESAGEAVLPGTIDASQAYAELLQQHGALGGNRTFALANALVAVEAIDVARLPEILGWQRLPDAGDKNPSATSILPPRVLVPAPITVTAGRESVSLRFMLGTAIGSSGVDPLRDTGVGKWGMPFTQMLGRALGAGRVPVLAMPRAPQRLLPAVQQGRAAQREVGASLFVGNAARKLRASVGEPTAVLSAHRCPEAPGGGELRLSLSSPFAPRDAEGFRCPLYPLDRVADVATMLLALLRDCRITDVQVRSGVYADRDPATGLTLLFKADSAAGELH
jgi:hypothetical protein